MYTTGLSRPHPPGYAVPSQREPKRDGKPPHNKLSELDEVKRLIHAVTHSEDSPIKKSESENLGHRIKMAQNFYAALTIVAETASRINHFNVAQLIQKCPPGELLHYLFGEIPPEDKSSHAYSQYISKVKDVAELDRAFAEASACDKVDRTVYQCYIQGLLKHGEYLRAFETFKEMVRLGFVPNRKEIQSKSRELMYVTNFLLSLITNLGRNGMYEQAREVYRMATGLDYKDVSIYCAQITNEVKDGKIEDAYRLFNHIVMHKILFQKSQSTDDPIGGLQRCLNSLIFGLDQNQMWEEATQVFDVVVQVKCEDGPIYNTLIGALVHNGKVREAYDAFNDMVKKGFLPQATDIDRAPYARGVMVGLITSLHQNGMTEESEQVFNTAITYGYSDPALYNTYISGLVSNEQLEKAYDTFNKMVQRGVLSPITEGDDSENIRHRQACTVSLVTGLDRNGMSDLSEQVFNKCIELGYANPPLYVTRISGLIVHGQPEKAYHTFKEMCDKRILVKKTESNNPEDVRHRRACITLLITSLDRNGMNEQAAEVFKKGLELGYVDRPAYITHISGLITSGKIKKAYEAFKEMIDQELLPSLTESDESEGVEYCRVCITSLIKGLCVNKQPKLATKILNIAVERGYVNGAMYSAYTSGMIATDEIRQAYWGFNEMVHRELLPPMTDVENLEEIRYIRGCMILLIKNLCENKMPEQATEVYNLAVKLGYADRSVYTVYTSKMAITGKIAPAYSSFFEMIDKGLLPRAADVDLEEAGYIRNCVFPLIVGLCENNMGEPEAAQVFAISVDKGYADKSVYVTFTHHMMKSGKAPLAYKSFIEMIRLGLVPPAAGLDADEVELFRACFIVLITGFGRSRMVENAKEVLAVARDFGYIDRAVYCAYISALYYLIDDVENVFYEAKRLGNDDPILDHVFIQALMQSERPDKIEQARRVFQDGCIPFVQKKQGRDLYLDLHDYSHGSGFIAVSLFLKELESEPHKRRGCNRLVLITGKGSEEKGNYLTFMNQLKNDLLKHLKIDAEEDPNKGRLMVLLNTPREEIVATPPPPGNNWCIVS